MNREEVLEALQPLSNVRVRTVEHGARTRVNVAPEMVTIRPGSGGQLVPISQEGVKNLVKFTGVPATLPNKLSHDTVGRILTELLATKQRYNLLLDNDQVVDVVEYRGIRTIEPERLVNTIDRTVRRAEYYRVLITGTHAATIEVVAERSKPVARGDIIRAGATISFSPINAIIPMVQSSVLRLVCTNGATAETVLREFHGGGGNGDGNIFDWFRNSIRDAIGALDDIVDRYRAMRTERLPSGQRASMLEALLRSAKITGEDADVLRAQALENPPRNTYELMNLITYASSHILREPRQIQIAQHAASVYTSEEEHGRVCPICHSTN